MCALAGLLQSGHLNRKHSIDLLEDLDLNFLNMNGTQKNEVRVRGPKRSSVLFFRSNANCKHNLCAVLHRT